MVERSTVGEKGCQATAGTGRVFLKNPTAERGKGCMSFFPTTLKRPAKTIEGHF
jgi:hypothetical protein